VAFDKEYPDGPPKPPPKPVKKVSTRPPSAYNVFVKQRLPIIKAEKGVRSLEAAMPAPSFHLNLLQCAAAPTTSS